MLIQDLDYVETIEETKEIKDINGGVFNIMSLLRNMVIYPISSAGINTMNGNSIGNSVTSFNISMPIFIFMGGSGSSRRSRWSSFFF